MQAEEEEAEKEEQKRLIALDLDAHEFIRELQKIDGGVSQAVKDAVRQFADEVHTHAKTNHGFKNRTGMLESSIGISMESESESAVHAAMEYASYVEYQPNASGRGEGEVSSLLDGRWRYSYLRPAIEAVGGAKRLSQLVEQYLNAYVES